MRSPTKKEDWQDRNRPPPVLDHQKDLAKLLNSFYGRHSHWQVFSDFCEMGAIAMSALAADMGYTSGEFQMSVAPQSVVCLPTTNHLIKLVY